MVKFRAFMPNPDLFRTTFKIKKGKSVNNGRKPSKMIEQLMFIPVKKDLSSQKFTTLKLLSYPMYLTHLSIITLVLVYSIIPGASHKNPDLVPNSGPIPDHF